MKNKVFQAAVHKEGDAGGRRPQTRFWWAASSAILLIFIAATACEEFSPINLQKKSIFLPAPDNVTLKLGNGYVVLTWEYPDTAAVKTFRIYRKAQNEEDFTRIGETEKKVYRDDYLANGTRYEYEIAAVNQDGVEGRHSKTVVGIPAIYSVQINDGALYTNSRRVVIKITAPNNTTLMMFSNDSTFTGAVWESFSTKKVWNLSYGDGEKVVYAKFRNLDDQEIDRPIAAKIILDQIATIAFLEEDSGGHILSSGDTLHIRMGTFEPNGRATVDIIDPSFSNPEEHGSVYGIVLFDDGTHGDIQAGDGIYEINYGIGHELIVEGALLIGNFWDPAGNHARTTAPTRITAHPFPTPVQLFEPTIVSGNEAALHLRWSRNDDPDFAAYQIMRSKFLAVSLASTLVAEIRNQDVTSYTDTNLQPNTKYYYRVYVFDRNGNSTGSNIESGTTPENLPPKPVVLSQPTQDSLALVLSWSPNTDQDFEHYRLYRSTTSPVDTSFAPIAIINNAATTQFRDFSAQPNITYFYRIFVYDKWGLGAGSNEVQGTLRR